MDRCWTLGFPGPGGCLATLILSPEALSGMLLPTVSVTIWLCDLGRFGIRNLCSSAEYRALCGCLRKRIAAWYFTLQRPWLFMATVARHLHWNLDREREMGPSSVLEKRRKEKDLSQKHVAWWKRLLCARACAWHCMWRISWNPYHNPWGKNGYAHFTDGELRIVSLMVMRGRAGSETGSIHICSCAVS